VQVTVDQICNRTFEGDVEGLGKLIADFSGDINQLFTNITALHMGVIAGQTKCIEMLLGAGANPHVRQAVSWGVDPETGATPRDVAVSLSNKILADLLEMAEKSAIKPEPKNWTPPSSVEGPNVVPKAKVVPAPVVATESLPVALLFPGQGSQYVGMLKAVNQLPEVKDMLEKSKQILGYDILDICLNGPEEKLGETRFTQPAMFIGGLAGVAKLRSEKPEKVEKARCAAGLSLGEYTALCFAGVLSFEDGLKLVKIRGEAMQEAAAVGKQGMLSVIGLEQKVLEKLCDAAAKETDGVCKIANFLFPKGFSCAGTQAAIDLLHKKADAAKALKCTPLKTSGGFHTSLMQPAADKLTKALEDALPNMKPNRIAVYSNVTARPLPAGTDPKEIVELLKTQLCNSVLWDPSISAMMKDGVKEYYECGPMKQIKAMMKRIDNSVWKATTNVEV